MSEGKLINLQPPNVTLSATQNAIIQSLLYFETFNHPLKWEELLFYANPKTNFTDLEEACEFLQTHQVVKQKHSLYYINLNEEYLLRRVEAEARYHKMMAKSHRYSKIIASFPFVRAVCISGSLSKGVAYPDGDVDYFIITHQNRLWMTKLLLVFFKRTVLLGSHKHFCLNYFLDNDHLALDERNLFTATELATVTPMYGYDEYENLIEQNSWLMGYYPNFQRRQNGNVINHIWPRFKKVAEYLLDNVVSDLIGDAFMKIVRRKYNRKATKPFTKEELAIMFKTKKHVSKVHYGNHQQRLLNAIEEKRIQFEEEYGFDLVNQYPSKSSSSNPR